MEAPPVELLLYRHVASAWEPCVRPWLEQAAHFAGRSWVVVSSRGQAQAWKQYCLERNLPLLGVEFLTPGLARQKWVAQGIWKPALGRELLLHGLGREVEAMLADPALAEADHALLLSLKTDLETALDDFDALLRAGFGPQAFPWPILTQLFERLEQWTASLGYELAPRQAIHAANSPSVLESRILVLGLGPENWGEFPNVVALVRRCRQATVVLPEPELRGGKDVDERWVEAWEAVLGVPAVPLDSGEPANCGSAVVGWLPGTDGDSKIDWARVSSVVARSSLDESALIAHGVQTWLAAGAESIAVVFPKADAVYVDVRARLGAAGVAFRDEIGAAGLVSPETACQRALLQLWTEGGRWNELLALWPHAVRQGKTRVALHAFRRAVQRWFDATQTLQIRDASPLIEAGTGEAAVALQKLLPALQLEWPVDATLDLVLRRCEEAWEAWETGVPGGWEALRAFAEREQRAEPPSRWFSLIQRFLAEPGTEAKPPGSAGFARVVLTTRRRADGAPWTHLWLAEGNAGVWPQRRESSCWLPDETRQELARNAPHRLAVFTADERAWLEKCAYARLARDTRDTLVISASVQDPVDPEAERAPNAWLERLLWQVPTRDQGSSLELAFRQAAVSADKRRPFLHREAARARAKVLKQRHDATKPFDEYLLSLRKPTLRPTSSAARVLEAALDDPAVLWFEEILKATPVSWEPLQRARRKWVGQTAHEVMARALRGEPAGGAFFCRPALQEAKESVSREVKERLSLTTSNAYWESCYTEVEGVCHRMLERLFSLPALPDYVAIEFPLPAGAWVHLGHEAEKFGLRGRIDAAFSDRPDWAGATVEVVDFKTGTEGVLTPERMAAGRALQLGLYLDAIRNLGAARGRVWMVRPGLVAPRSVAMEDLDTALAGLDQIKRHLDTGIFGARTPDVSPFSSGGLQWPLACVRIPAAVLEARFAKSFHDLVPEVEEAKDEG
ncbi:MAG: PD-(D/E)XK nuclease family protein [Opitutaceae bacterium]|nr:PD-(D/E)XK nuclease family protein [Opitutaceae bacterium]